MHEKLMTINRDMRQVKENILQAEGLAKEILQLARNTLLLHLRFLDRALVRFIPVDSALTTEIATNGQYLYFNPTFILRSYRAERQLPARDYLHVTLHCIFRHLFVAKELQPEIWDLATDIAVENIINSLQVPSLVCRRQEQQGAVLQQLCAEVYPLTAEKLYKYFAAQKIEKGEFAHLRASFYSDDHALWHEDNAQTLNPSEQANQEDSQDDAKTDDEQQIAAQGEQETSLQPPEKDDKNSVQGQGGQKEQDVADAESSGSSGEMDEQKGDEPNLTKEELEKIWRDISERVQADMDTQPASWGQSDGSMQQALRSVNREKLDYTNFLRHFTVLGENMQLNDEEFDLIFYTYGFAHYGNMPLLEPLESKETKRIREFVIAIDTSESVENTLVHKFITKTYNILKQTDSFFTKTNIHIIQCGASVTEDVKLTRTEEFDEYLKHMTLKGFGGTDFRAVFSYVDGLIATREFTNFKGLIYFTDGFGTFPVTRPAYDVAFVFVEDDSNTKQEARQPEIPIWAAKVMLRKDDLELF